MGETSKRMTIENRVYQRDKKGNASIELDIKGPARVRVRLGSRFIRPWHETQGVVNDLPTGGPYTIEVETSDGKTLQFKGILVGDLWVLAGQSNMDGCGRLVDLEPPSRMVHCYYYNERWSVAKDPLCVLVDSIDPVHWPCEEKDLYKAREDDRNYRDFGGGPGISFGKKIYRATGVPIGLIACSHGGTSMAQWDPQLKDMGGKSLYGSMMRRINACGGKVKGVLWYQGESDANFESMGAYKDRMKAFIKSVRTDLGSAKLPFIMAQIGRFFVDELQYPPCQWNNIQQAQLELEDEMEAIGVVATIDGHLSDLIHIDTPSARKLGTRFAELALVMTYAKKGNKALRPGKIHFADKNRTRLCIQYKNVRGKLTPTSGVWGFVVEDDGKRIPIRSATTKGTSVILGLAQSATRNVQLWYGRGCNPTANLHDNTFSAPVFGPVTVK